ncbi:MAG: Sel1 domain protein repeat-containing protein [Pedosphaera sp.]|nr:Sel1 domain protein repeat-containing protein [Pedosphaera sp.]
MKRIILEVLTVILLAGCVGSCFGQSNLPSLAQIKMAAENGDAKAQDKLGDAYQYSRDFTNALVWYRKAAEQGVANSQYELGTLLMNGGYDSMFHRVKSTEKMDEAIKWFILSGRQRFLQAEIALGHFYKDGQGVKKDWVEAYKWYSLAHDGQAFEVVGGVYRDRLVLKMTSEQINEGQERVKKFLASPDKSEPMPEPSFVDHLKLGGISGADNHRLAIINNHTFAAGEDAKVKIDGRVVNIHCLEIREDSVLIKAEGVEKSMELKLK